MRGSLAKALRRTCARNLWMSSLLPSVESRYVPVPRTERVHTALVPQMQADGNVKLVPVETYRTVTLSLAPDCRRYFTQQFKRRVLKHRRST